MFHNSWLFFGLLEFLCCTHSTLGTLGDFSFNKFYLLLRKGSGLLIQGLFFFFFGFNFLPYIVYSLSFLKNNNNLSNKNFIENENYFMQKEQK